MNRYCVFITGLILVLILYSCYEHNYYSGNNPYLIFSDDTIHFDTVFTTIGSTTRELRVINPFDEWIVIEQISLDDSNESFRINVDGLPASTIENTEIGPGDSIFIFIDVLIDPANADSPVAETAAINFMFNDNLQEVHLIAWGQDIILIDGEIIGTQVWNEKKPYVVYNSMMVDTGEVLTIEEGVRVMFHRSSTMYVAGTLIVNGKQDNPVSFTSDRMEEMYYDVPGQWTGLYFLNGSSDNILNNVRIEMAETGIHLGNLGSYDPAPDIDLRNVYLQHMTVCGLSSIGATVSASNCLISHYGYYGAFLSKGGNYSFNHCSIESRWDYSLRTSPSLILTDFYEYSGDVFSGEIVKAEFNNTVITGELKDEILLSSYNSYDLNIQFNNCLLNSEFRDGYNMTEEKFSNCIFNIDPLFIDSRNYDYRPDTLSPLINKGWDDILMIIPEDIRGYSRMTDGLPDIGAYERIPGESASAD